MKRVKMNERPGWKGLAEEVGFKFHTIDGDLYWDESRAYALTLRQIEDDLESPTAELEQMCYAVVSRVVESEELLARLCIPQSFWQLVQASWNRRDKNLYGRFDFSYNGTGPAKLLEYNADTPTSLYESAVFQWWWLEQAMEQGIIPRGCDQFNSLEEKLIDAFRRFDLKGMLHFACTTESEEDKGTVTYLEGLAQQAGLKTNLLDMQQIGVDAQGRFTDLSDRVIVNLFKLYPWEWLIADDFGVHLLRDQTTIIEPTWKLILSNKGMLPLLWEMFPSHPNLLPAYFADDTAGLSNLGSTYVRKPLFSREGANVEVVTFGKTTVAVDGPYGAEGYIVQAFHPLPKFDESYALIGSWVVAGQPAGIGIREDTSIVTKNTSRFVPHFIQ